MLNPANPFSDLLVRWLKRYSLRLIYLHQQFRLLSPVYLRLWRVTGLPPSGQ